MAMPGFVNRLLLLTTYMFYIVEGDGVCDGNHCADLLDPEHAELYLLQKKAQVIRKTTMVETASLARDIAKQKARITATPVERSTRGPVKEQLQHSKTSAFVTALRRSRHVTPLTHEQRIKMFSTAEASGLSESWKKAIIGACCLVLALALLAITVVNFIETRFSRVFGDIILQGIDTISEDIIGLDVTIGAMSVAVMQGKVTITNLKLANPPGCKSESFVHSNTVDLRLNLWNYAWKRCFGKEVSVEVDSILLRDVNLNFEQSASSSNAQDILERALSAEATPVKAKHDKNDYKLLLHNMMIADAGATVPFWGRVPVPTVQCKDFDQATAGRARSLQPIVVEILREFCQTGDWAGGVANGSKEKEVNSVSHLDR
jgi:hypothetical protein